MMITMIFSSGDDRGRGANGIGLVKGGRGREDGSNALCGGEDQDDDDVDDDDDQDGDHNGDQDQDDYENDDTNPWSTWSSEK